MPISKKEKVVHLSKTVKKGKEGKNKLVEAIRQAFDDYDKLFLLKIKNPRNNFLTEIRKFFVEDGRLFTAKNKVMQYALGKTESEEWRTNVSELSKQIKGSVFLLFTNQSESSVLRFFQEYHPADFANSGFVATETHILSAGPLDKAIFPHSTEPMCRNDLRMPTQLKNGVVTLMGDHVASQKGKALSVEQAKLLRHLGIKMSIFSIAVVACWTNDAVKQYIKIDDEEDDEEDDDEIEE